MNSLVNSSRAHVADPRAGEQAADVVPDRVQQVGLAQPGVAVDQQRVVGLARRLGDGDRGGVREPVGRADHEGLEDVLRVEPGLQGGAGGLAAGGRDHRRRYVEWICRHVDGWIDRRTGVDRAVDGPGLVGVADCVVAGRRATGGRGGALELGVHGHRDPHLGAERVAEGVLEPGAQPALELVAGELVGDRDDRGVLVQRDRAARGQPGPLVGRQVVDQRAPDGAEIGRRCGARLAPVRCVVRAAGAGTAGGVVVHAGSSPINSSCGPHLCPQVVHPEPA